MRTHDREKYLCVLTVRVHRSVETWGPDPEGAALALLSWYWQPRDRIRTCSGAMPLLRWERSASIAKQRSDAASETSAPGRESRNQDQDQDQDEDEDRDHD